LNNPAANPSRPEGKLVPPFLLHPGIFLVLRIFFGALFLYSGAVKLGDTSSFSETISAYRLLPNLLVPCAAMGLPLAEIVAGLGTLLNRRWAMLGMLSLMILFLGVLSYGVSIGLDIDCGCFSGGDASAKTAPQVSPPPVSLPSDPGISGVEGIDSTLIPIEPGPGQGVDAVCARGGGDPTRLRKALVRDIFLFLGVLYMVAYPDLRRRYSKPKAPNPGSGN